MTDHEKDREAVEEFAAEVEDSEGWGIHLTEDTLRRILALAQGALAMREREPDAWLISKGDHKWVRVNPPQPGSPVARGESGYRCRPLYAGEPMEVDDE